MHPALDRRVVGRSRHLPQLAAAAIVFALLWVPAVGRAMQPLVAGHAIGGLAKVAKAAVLPQDPSASLPYVASIASPVPTPVDSCRVRPADDFARASERAVDGVGLRAPPLPAA